MRRTQISYSGAVDLNTFDLPAAVRTHNSNPFSLEKQAYALGNVPLRRASPVFDSRNRPPPLPPGREDSDLLPITEQPRPRRGVRNTITSPPPADEDPRVSLIRPRPTAMQTAEEEQKDSKSGPSGDTSTVKPKNPQEKATPKEEKSAVPTAIQKVKPLPVSWPGPDDECANGCILWCCCCVGLTKWPPKGGCCPDKSCSDICCPCCRDKTCLTACCPCCSEWCETCCEGCCKDCCDQCGQCTCKGCLISCCKGMRNECCGVCIDISDDEEEDDNKGKDKKNGKSKTEGNDKGKPDGKDI